MPSGGYGQPAVLGYDKRTPSSGSSERAHPLAVIVVAIIGVAAVLALVAVAVEFARADLRAAERLALSAPREPALVPSGSAATPSRTPASDSAGGSSAASGGSDQCLVGRWRVTAHQEEIVLPELGRVSFDGAVGSVMTFGADGTGSTDFGVETSYRGTVDGVRIRVRVKGQLQYSYRASNGLGATTDAVSNASFRVYVPGEPASPAEIWPANKSPWAYECSVKRLVVTGSEGAPYEIRSELVRVD